jgi:amphi-Trp domain-containing protein
MARKGTKTAKATDRPAGRKAYVKPSAVDAAVKRIAGKIPADGRPGGGNARDRKAPARTVAVDAEIIRLEGNRNVELERLLGESAAPDAHPRGKKKTKIRYESYLDGDAARACLESIIAGLTGGSLRLRNGEDSVALSPVSPFRMTVKATQKKKDECVKLEIRWRRRSGENLDIIFR